jgi:hypothetical protein
MSLTGDNGLFDLLFHAGPAIDRQIWRTYAERFLGDRFLPDFEHGIGIKKNYSSARE